MRRLGLFMRLLDSPRESWQHVALCVHALKGSAWYAAALHDFFAVHPNASVNITIDPCFKKTCTGHRSTV